METATVLIIFIASLASWGNWVLDVHGVWTGIKRFERSVRRSWCDSFSTQVSFYTKL